MCRDTTQVGQSTRLRSHVTIPKYGGVLGIEEIYPNADGLSSINVHFAPDGLELGWHFDNSAFAVTMFDRTGVEYMKPLCTK